MSFRSPIAYQSSSRGVDVGPHHRLGSYGKPSDGPLLLVSGGMHGNEPGGVLAIQRVLLYLHEHKPKIHGRMVGLAGNLGGLRRGVRYIDRDLNRNWDKDSLETLMSGATGLAEDIERIELLHEFEYLLAEKHGKVSLLDLHSMSANGVPFVVTSDDPELRLLAQHLILPAIAGLERSIPGTTLQWFADRGHNGLAIEGGQHDDPRTAQVMEAAMWKMMLGLQMIDPTDVPDLTGQNLVLAQAADGMPGGVRVTYRHGIEPSDEFEMLPGFRNLQAVRRGQVLARDRQGVVVAPEDGWILLPLYQKVGADGFFIGTGI